MTADRERTAASTEHGEDRGALQVSTSFGIGRSQCRLAPVALERGTVVAGFTIEEPIGSGGMGSVYRAMQASPRRTVALKVILSRRYTPLAADADASETGMPLGDCVGTPQDMSPEQFLDDRPRSIPGATSIRSAWFCTST